MSRPFIRAGRLISVWIFLTTLLLPLFSLEEGDWEDFPVLEGEELTIVGTSETTQQMKVLTKEEIDRAHAPDLATLLQETLDLGLTRYGPYGNQTDINMRGFDSERIAFLVDGVPINSPVSGDFDLSLIDLNSVERIEVIYGGSDSKYNVTGALGGVINIITVKKQGPGLRIGGGLSNTSALPGLYYDRNGKVSQPSWQDLADTQQASFSLGLGLEKFSLTANVFANRAENHFLFMDGNNKIRRKDNNEVWDTGVSASLIRDLPDYAKLIIGGDFYYGDKNIPTSGFSGVAKKQYDISARQNLMLDMPLAFREELSTEASLSHAWHFRDYGGTVQEDRSIMVINRWGWYPWEKLAFRMGGDYRYGYFESAAMGWHDRHDGGLYLTAEYKPEKSFLVIPSIKTVFFGSGTVAVVPKIGFLSQVADFLSIKNNYFCNFKIPDFEDLYWVGGGMYGNPDLRPEDGWGTDLGLIYTWQDRVTVEGISFYQDTTDSIHWYPSGETYKPTNVGEAVFFGVDLKLHLDIPLPRGPFEKIGISLSYQYLLSYLLSYGYDYASDKRIPYMPLHTAGFSLDLPWKIGARRQKGSLLISGHYEGRRYADVANLTKLKPYFLLNLNINQEINKHLSGFMVLRNILNKPYESFDEYYMPGLTITLGARMNFI